MNKIRIDVGTSKPLLRAVVAAITEAKIVTPTPSEVRGMLEYIDNGQALSLAFPGSHGTDYSYSPTDYFRANFSDYVSYHVESFSLNVILGALLSRKGKIIKNLTVPNEKERGSMRTQPMDGKVDGDWLYVGCSKVHKDKVKEAYDLFFK